MTADGAQYIFLFTDLEGSSRLWEREPERMRASMARHDAILRTAVRNHGGMVVKMAGDGIHAVFGSPAFAADGVGGEASPVERALLAAVDMQREMRALERESGLGIRVRCGLHAGTAEFRDADFYGPAVNRAARLANAANGGQIVLSASLVDLLGGAPPEPLALRPLGNVRLRDLSGVESVYQLAHPDLPAEFPPLRSLSTNPNNLPSVATSFVGRFREVGQVRELFSRGRIVTLAGAGGIGKTRLALQSAAYLLDRYPDGVWIVELANLQNAEGLAGAVLTALGARQQKSDLMAALAEHLKPLGILIVLDNCEHLIDAVARLADTLVKAAPGLHLLATSRETLDIDGEQILNVPTLALPDPDHDWQLDRLRHVESVRLLLERVLAQRPDFEPAPEDAAPLARIAYRLDGIPLAIELAAARLRTMSLTDLNAALDDRFGTLTTGSRVALPRHKTLRGLIDWSYQLLSAEERLLFNRLTVFVGGWTTAAAVRVCAGGGLDAARIPDLLASLADKSLILAEHSSAAPRQRMLETLREFGGEFLAPEERTALDRAHAGWAREFTSIEHSWRAVDADHSLLAPLYDAEYPNFRAALDWLDTHDAAGHLQLISNIGNHWAFRGRIAEGRRHVERAVVRCGDAPPSEDVAYAHCYLAVYAYMQGDQATVTPHARQSHAMFLALGNPGRAGHSLVLVAYAEYILRGHATSKPLFEEAIQLMISGGRLSNAANDLVNLANNCLYADEADEARRHIDRAESLWSGLRNAQLGRVIALHRGQAAIASGDFAGAERHFASVIESAVASGYAIDHGLGQYWRGRALCGLGRLGESWTCHLEGIRILRTSALWLELVNALESFAVLLAAAGQAEEAATLLAAMEAERERIAFPVGAQARRVRASVQPALEASLPPDARERLAAAGKRLGRADVLAFVQNLPPVADAAPRASPVTAEHPVG